MRPSSPDTRLMPLYLRDGRARQWRWIGEDIGLGGVSVGRVQLAEHGKAATRFG